MRQTWTDDRMDDLAGRVDAGFVQEKLRSELREEMTEIRAELRHDLSAQADRIDRLQLTIIIAGFIGLAVAIFARAF
jgi:hypothetical protein